MGSVKDGMREVNIKMTTDFEEQFQFNQIMYRYLSTHISRSVCLSVCLSLSLHKYV